MNLEIYIGDTITRISYWDDVGMLDYTTKHEELHFNIRGVEIDFISGKTLSINCPHMTGGLDFYDQSLKVNEWDDSAIKVDMSKHSLFKNLINKKITKIQVLWCDNLWQSDHEPKSYKQDLVINTEENGYFLCSSAEAEELKPAIYLTDSDEIVVITDEQIAQKHELEQYGKNEFKRYKKSKV